MSLWRVGQFRRSETLTMHTPTLGPMGPFSIKICGLFDSIARRLVPAYLFGEAVVERSNCHSFARVGGAISAQFPPNFAYKGPKARGKWYHRTCFRPAGRFLKVCRRAFPAKRGPGMATMNTRLWRGVHRRSPLGASLVPFCASRKEHPSLNKGTRPAGRNPAKNRLLLSPGLP